MTNLINPTSGQQRGQILTGSHDKTVKQWCIVSGQCINSWQHSSPITSVAITKGGQYILFGSKKQDVEMQDGQMKVYSKINSGTGVTAINICKCCEHAIVGYESGLIQLQDIQSGKIIRKISGHNDKINKVIYTNDNKQFISASDDYTLKIWDVNSVFCIFRLHHQGKVTSVEVSKCSKYIISSSSDGITQIWNLSTGILQQTLLGHKGAVTSVSVGDKYILTGGIDGKINVQSVLDFRLIKQLDNEQPVTSVVISKEGFLAVIGDDNYGVKLWDIEQGTVIQSQHGHSGRISSIAMSMQSDDM